MAPCRLPLQPLLANWRVWCCGRLQDDLEARTRPLMAEARKRLSQQKGPDALEPWNMGACTLLRVATCRPLVPAAIRPRQRGAAALAGAGYLLAGDTEKAMDPYFPFEDAVDVWARTFAGLGINYRSSTMTLDL